MRRFFVTLLLLSLLAPAAQAEVRVVATLPWLGSLVEAVGAGHASVTVLASPTADPHFLDGRPSYVLDLSRADLLVFNGADLEIGWLPPLVASARNADILPGKPGSLDASAHAGPLLDVGGSADRARGDVHPGGNPHFGYDPRYGANVAREIAKRLAAIDPEHAAEYTAAAKAFRRRLGARVVEWNQRMAKAKGAPIVSYHKTVAYLARWLGLKRAGYVEPLPGISPNPAHLAKLVAHMKRHGVRVVVSEPWYDAETARVVAEQAGAALVRLPGDVGAEGITDYIGLIEAIVSRFEKAL